MNMPIDYSLDKIQVSDDEDDTHHNIGTPLLFRLRQQARVEREEEMKQSKKEVKEEQTSVRNKIQEFEEKLNISFKTPTSIKNISMKATTPTSVSTTSNFKTPTSIKNISMKATTPTSVSTTSNFKTPTSIKNVSMKATSPISVFTTTNNEGVRPVTPTDQIIGSLWDDINSEMEKYKQTKQYQSDPNLSPRAHIGGSLQEGHSILAYRSQSVKRMGQPETEKPGTFTHDSLSELPEKRKKAELGVNQKQSDPKLKRLHDSIVVQQDQICQASRALAFCRQNERFRGSREEIDAQRALLISTERRKALLHERGNVIEGRYSTENDLRGTLTFTSIAIKLSREYIAKYLQTSANLYYFIVLLKCGEHVFHTTLAQSDQGIRSGFIEFSHCITISGLSPDFSCDLDVYSLKAGFDSTVADKHFHGKKGTWRRIAISTPFNTFNSIAAYPSSAHRPYGVMDTGFQHVGHLAITRQMIQQQNMAQQQKHVLTQLTYPLDGTVVMTLDCQADINSVPFRDYRSFLSLYELVSGLSSWTRFWCSLSEGHLRFWRYPEDEVTKKPCVHLDLGRCVSQVVAVPSSAASFPNSMQVEVVRIDEKTQQRDYVNVMMFAADTPEEKEQWMDCINHVIRRINVWRTFKRK